MKREECREGNSKKVSEIPLIYCWPRRHLLFIKIQLNGEPVTRVGGLRRQSVTEGDKMKTRRIGGRRRLCSQANDP